MWHATCDMCGDVCGAGCYMFSLHVCTHDMKKVLAAIRRNGVEVATLFDQVRRKYCYIWGPKTSYGRTTSTITRTAWRVRRSSWSWHRGTGSRWLSASLVTHQCYGHFRFTCTHSRGFMTNLEITSPSSWDFYSNHSQIYLPKLRSLRSGSWCL